MRQLSYKIESLNNNVSIPLGDQCENACTELLIDISEWLEDTPLGIITVLVERPDRQVYLADSTVEDGILHWVVDNVATDKCGLGHLQIQMTSGDIIIKSTMCETKVLKCLHLNDSVPVVASPNWVDELLQDVEEASMNAARAVRDIQCHYDFDTGELVFTMERPED